MVSGVSSGCRSARSNCPNLRSSRSYKLCGCASGADKTKLTTQRHRTQPTWIDQASRGRTSGHQQGELGHPKQTGRCQKRCSCAICPSQNHQPYQAFDREQQHPKHQQRRDQNRPAFLPQEANQQQLRKLQVFRQCFVAWPANISP